jgi:hypothetical protein
VTTVGLILSSWIVVTRVGGSPDLGPSYEPTELAGIQLTPPPWAPEKAHLRDRLDAMGLPVSTTAGTAVNLEAHLDLLVDGLTVAVPAEIGVGAFGGFRGPLSTQDASGIIHVDSPIARSFTLGQFIDVWGVSLDDDCVGGRCDGMGRLLYVWVNGQPYAGSPRDILLAQHQEIVLSLGTPAEMPSPVPARYAFSSGTDTPEAAAAPGPDTAPPPAVHAVSP